MDGSWLFCLQKHAHIWLCSIKVLSSKDLVHIHQIPADISARKNKENCIFCEQDTLKRVMYHTCGKVEPNGGRAELSRRLYSKNTPKWKKKRNLSKKFSSVLRCVSTSHSTVAGARYFMAFWVCVKQNMALSMVSGDRTDGQVLGRNSSIKTWMRKKTATWLLSLKYLTKFHPKLC